MLGASQFLEPNKRKEMFHSYYLRGKDLLKSEDDSHDKQFEEFYIRKSVLLSRAFSLGTMQTGLKPPLVY
ncbi:unnamed protein product [Calypogeia fissa]